MSLFTGEHLIAGAASRQGDATFSSFNPQTAQPNPIQYANATPAEIDAAVRAATEAFRTSRNLPPQTLALFLETIAAEIEALGDVLLETADLETALGVSPRLSGECARTTGQLQAFARLLKEGSYVEAIIDSAQPDRQPAPRPSIRRMLFPLGVVAVFGASNFPLAFSVAGGDTASAFAAGCPVIVKAHPSHPQTSELVGRAIAIAVQKCGLPAGMFSLLHGASVDVGQALVGHPQLAAVGFTGSLRGGRALFDAAARRETPIPVYAEMGSTNPVILLPAALQNRAAALAEGLAASVTLGAGQFCTNPGIVLLQDSPQAAQLIEDVASLMAAKPPQPMLNAPTQAGLARTVEQTAAKPHVTVRTGAQPLQAQGYLYPNTVMQTSGTAFISDGGLQIEHFGATTLFVVCADEAELLRAVDVLHGNLTATVHAEPSELTQVAALFDALREKVGRLILNSFPTGVEVVHAMQHGGPYPATTAPASTSVGMTAIKRFMRPVAFQGMPDALLPPALQDANPLGIMRIVDDVHTRAPLS